MAKWTVVIVLFLLPGCDFVESQIESYLYRGTHIGVQKCIDRNGTASIEMKSLRNACARKHQKEVKANFGGKAGFKKAYDGGYNFSGHVINRNPNAIVTSYRVFLKHKDMAENKNVSKFFQDVWIEPNKSHEFTIKKSELDFQPAKDRLESGDDVFQWSSNFEQGVTIKTD